MPALLAQLTKSFCTQSLGFSLFLAWNYYAFFSCGLSPVIRILRTIERAWLWAGLIMLPIAVVIILVSTRTALARNKAFGIAGGVLASLGTIVIWASCYSETSFLILLGTGGAIAGAGLTMMGCLWCDRLSRRDEASLEFAVPASFVISFVVYFVLLAAKGPITFAIAVALPPTSMHLAFRKPALEHIGAHEPSNIVSFQSIGKQIATNASLFLIIALLWFQFAYFRLLSTPDVLGDRFVHYLFPFSASFLLSIVAMLLSIKIARYLNFSIVYRWGLPLMVLSYALLFSLHNDATGKIIAYTVNFVSMFGVQFGCWVSAPKYVRRSGASPIVLMCGIMASQGIGIFAGTITGFYAYEIDQDAVMSMTLVFFAVLLFSVMAFGFSPNWAFHRRTSTFAEARASFASLPEEDSRHINLEGADPHAGAEDRFASLSECRAAELRKIYGLSQRETEVAALLLAGHSRPYIRDELGISLNTVHSHVSNVYNKCNVHSNREFMELRKGVDSD